VRSGEEHVCVCVCVWGGGGVNRQWLNRTVSRAVSCRCTRAHPPYLEPKRLPTKERDVNNVRLVYYQSSKFGSYQSYYTPSNSAAANIKIVFNVVGTTVMVLLQVLPAEDNRSEPTQRLQPIQRDGDEWAEFMVRRTSCRG
jgi:hypothetical protein